MTTATMVKGHTLEVRRVIRETDDAVSLEFDVPTGDGGFRYQPGQFLTLRIPGDSGAVSRCYSLSSAPTLDPYPQITVKRTVDGIASNWLCDNAEPGMRLESLHPAGIFVPKDWDAPFVLVAGGSGITPVMSILKTALTKHRNRVELVYANRDIDSVIFVAELAEFERKFAKRLSVHHWLEADRGRPTAQSLRRELNVPKHSRAYLCGPAPFMAVAESALTAAGVGRDRIHKEVFVSLASDAFDTPAPVSASIESGAATVTAEVDGDDHVVTWPRQTPLLDVLLDAGVDAPYVCREGSCGGCAFTLVSGEVRMLANHTLDKYDLDKGVRLACQSLPVTDTVRAVFDQ